MKPINIDDDEYGVEYEDVQEHNEISGAIEYKRRKKTFDFPDQRMNRFDPIPSDDMLHWIYFYFFPYNRTFNTAHCMTFKSDQRQDDIERIRHSCLT